MQLDRLGSQNSILTTANRSIPGIIILFSPRRAHILPVSSDHIRMLFPTLILLLGLLLATESSTEEPGQRLAKRR